MPGRGILKFRNTYYAFAKEMVYSLLVGRMLVIHAMPENENFVREMINTLSIFVPGQWWETDRDASALVGKKESSDVDGCISYWRTKPITVCKHYFIMY